MRFNMNKIFEQCVVDGELTPELIKRKQELDREMDAELAEVEAGRGRLWVHPSVQKAEIQQKYDDIWEQELTDAGYFVRPVFEDWYEELNKIN